MALSSGNELKDDRGATNYVPIVGPVYDRTLDLLIGVRIPASQLLHIKRLTLGRAKSRRLYFAECGGILCGLAKAKCVFSGPHSKLGVHDGDGLRSREDTKCKPQRQFLLETRQQLTEHVAAHRC